LVPALFLLPLLQLILPSELCIARGVFPLTCRRGPHVAAASTHPSSSIIFGPPTRPRTIISSLVMVLCICSPSKKFPAIESPSCGSHPSLQKPQLQNRKVCPTSCRNKGTRPLPYSWETSPLPARRQARANAPGAPQASVFRVQKRRPSKILTTRQQLSITDRPNVASLRGPQHVRLGRQETKQAGLSKDLYCMRYALSSL
jgi:hypothetical protein